MIKASSARCGKSSQSHLEWKKRSFQVVSPRLDNRWNEGPLKLINDQLVQNFRRFHVLLWDNLSSSNLHGPCVWYCRLQCRRCEPRSNQQEAYLTGDPVPGAGFEMPRTCALLFISRNLEKDNLKNVVFYLSLMFFRHCSHERPFSASNLTWMLMLHIPQRVQGLEISSRAAVGL